MKVIPEEYLYFRFLHTDLLQSIRKLHLNPQAHQDIHWMSEEEKKERALVIDEMLWTDSRHKVYFLTAAVQELAHMILVKDDFPLKQLLHAPIQKATYITGKDSFYRVWVRDERIYVLYGTGDNNRFDYHLFSFHTNTNEKGMSLSGNIPDEIWKSFVRFFLFIHLTPVSFITVEPAKKSSKKTDPNNVFNATHLPFIVVKSTWNQIIQYRNSSTVRAHIRFQACGPGWTDHKPVLIKQHTREGRLVHSRKA